MSLNQQCIRMFHVEELHMIPRDWFLFLLASMTHQGFIKLIDLLIKLAVIKLGSWFGFVASLCNNLTFIPLALLCHLLCICFLQNRTVMKSGSEQVRLGLRMFFENAAEDLEKTFENLKLGKFTHSRSQMKGVSQNINYTTVALLPILTALFEHITQHHFGVDLLCKSWHRRASTLVGSPAKR